MKDFVIVFTEKENEVVIKHIIYYGENKDGTKMDLAEDYDGNKMFVNTDNGLVRELTVVDVVKIGRFEHLLYKIIRGLSW